MMWWFLCLLRFITSDWASLLAENHHFANCLGVRFLKPLLVIAISSINRVRFAVWRVAFCSLHHWGRRFIYFFNGFGSVVQGSGF